MFTLKFIRGSTTVFVGCRMYETRDAGENVVVTTYDGNTMANGVEWKISPDEGYRRCYVENINGDIVNHIMLPDVKRHGHFARPIKESFDVTKAEAYANAKVKQALDEALRAVIRCKTSGHIRNDTVDKCANVIRALIPSQEK